VYEEDPHVGSGVPAPLRIMLNWKLGLMMRLLC
jgi:hypothetical protein